MICKESDKVERLGFVGVGGDVAQSNGGSIAITDDWPPYNPGEIRPYEPSLMDRWSENTNFFSKMGYDLVDGVWVLGQSLVSGPRSEVTHLNGTPTISDERVMAFGNTVSWGITAGELSTFKGITNGVYSSRWGLRIQAHAHSLSPPKGMVSFSMSPWHINLNKIHIITNPTYWRTYGLIFTP